MATTIKTVETLDINFHVDDGTVLGDNFVWKLNNPISTEQGMSLGLVKEAFGYNMTTGEIDPSKVGFLAYQAAGVLEIQTKSGYKIDGIDGAAITKVVTTKTDLS